MTAADGRVDADELVKLYEVFGLFGLPLTALYFAGTTGLSAVGITSHLAAIGSYIGLAVLGLNPMTAGIAGLILGGVAVAPAREAARAAVVLTDMRRELESMEALRA